MFGFSLYRLLLPMGLLALCLTGCRSAAVAVEQTNQARPLDAYIAKADPSFKWEFVKSFEAEGVTVDCLRMTSQTWRSETEITPAQWRHWVNVIRPEKISTNTALLFITGGSNRDEAPRTVDNALIELAVRSQAVVAQLRTVPNQPTVFAGESEKRGEDGLIAHSWTYFIETGDEEWIAQLPMTKSAVRAMDAVQEYLEPIGKVEDFVVCGASKRGWTTWLTAASDPRVRAAIPVVIDVLNMNASMRHHYASYGFWSPAINDYVEHKIMEHFDTPAGEQLLSVVDPLSYCERYMMPKYIINASGDQFFLPDSSQFYYDQLPGPKYLRYVPNTGHSLQGSDAYHTILAFFGMIVYEKPVPQIDWEFDGETLTVTSETAPEAVKFWQAYNPEARDFRFDRIGEAWVATDLYATEPGSWQAKLETPENGWRGGFIECTFMTPWEIPFKLTTSIYVMPDVEPFAEKPMGFNLEPMPAQ